MEADSTSSKLHKLLPFLDTHGIMRMKSRLENSPVLSDETKFPVILENCRCTELLIMWNHEKLQHFGKETLVNEMRQQYWIPDLRSTVNKVTQNRQICKIKKAKPVTAQMAPLPEFQSRLTSYFKPVCFKIGAFVPHLWQKEENMGASKRYDGENLENFIAPGASPK